MDDNASNTAAARKYVLALYFAGHKTRLTDHYLQMIANVI